jgi:hypothetical protein
MESSRCFVSFPLFSEHHVWEYPLGHQKWDGPAHGVQGASAIVDAKLQRFYSHHPGILGIFFAYVV